MDKQPFWQQFMLKICECVGVDPTKQPVSAIHIDMIPGRLPKITIHMEPFTDGEIKPIVETFTMADWQNTRATNLYQESFDKMTQEERQRLYKQLHERFGCKIYDG